GVLDGGGVECVSVVGAVVPSGSRRKRRGGRALCDGGDADADVPPLRADRPPVPPGPGRPRHPAHPASTSCPPAVGLPHPHPTARLRLASPPRYLPSLAPSSLLPPLRPQGCGI